MKKITLGSVLFILLSVVNTNAQITFETFLNITKIYGAEQNPDGSYILCFDSAGAGVMKLDGCGDRLWTTFPSVRRNDEKIYDVAPDPFTGGYIAGGNSPDSTGIFDDEPTLLLLDANGNLTASRILLPGDVGGSVNSVSATPDSGYIAGVFLDQFGGSNSSGLSRFDLSLGDVWNVPGSGSTINSSSVNINPSNQYLFSSYSVIGASSPTVRQVDDIGAILNNFVIPDTFQGGVFFFNNAVMDDCPDGNYIIGATLSPNTSAYDYPYIVKLDDVLNVVWQKIFDWGHGAQVLSVLSTPDSGSLCMLNVSDTIIFLRLNSIGDSLWSRTYTGIGTVQANQLRHCKDGGYLLSGSTSNGVDDFGFILKLDSMAGILPSVCIQTSSSTVICPGSNVTLTADSGYHYLWSTSETTQSIVVDTIGSYYVTVTDTVSGLFAQSENVEVSFRATTIPTINLLVTLLVSSPAMSYQWLFNGDTLVGETGSDITPLLTGDYSVIVEDSNGCILTSLPYSFIMPGISELETVSAFEVNKINQNFVELSVAASHSGILRLMDIRGVVVQKLDVNSGGERFLQVPVSHLAVGIYSLVWLSDKSVQVERILIGY